MLQEAIVQALGLLAKLLRIQQKPPLHLVALKPLRLWLVCPLTQLPAPPLRLMLWGTLLPILRAAESGHPLDLPPAVAIVAYC